MRLPYLINQGWRAAEGERQAAARSSLSGHAAKGQYEDAFSTNKKSYFTPTSNPKLRTNRVAHVLAHQF